ncbi:MAG TPA: hypothetical protein VJX73_04370 [Terracidiphilus sp.]|nr:hypothetical protein [Terracidiphilus sp.]
MIAVSRIALLFYTLLLFVGPAFAQSAEKEPVAILELGAAASRSLNDGGSAGGPSFAVEVTPVKEWLEIEAGVTPLFSKQPTEWDTDLLFKKPWTLSRKVEFMAGIGPEWEHTRHAVTGVNALAGEAALDFMFWPTRRRKFGWYLEPAYDHGFVYAHDQSMGVTGGLLIAFP